jgi:ATPase subunit of ABC transporter with duplicated ATPase domains
MARFEGTVLAVVHDRYFIERFATVLWLAEEGAVRVLTD